MVDVLVHVYPVAGGGDHGVALLQLHRVAHDQQLHAHYYGDRDDRKELCVHVAVKVDGVLSPEQTEYF